ncbi:MAG: DUF4190 domain-containing protein [Phycisphaeraceae bacterium]|nr:DUF4190 domain-containing protein [Phycisphaeraceae bacterium]
MSRNPFQHPMDEPMGSPSPRVSGLAVSSLVFGLLCCIPGSGLIGTILGAVGLASISKSDGRLTGRGMAFTGLILGLLGTVLWLGIGIGGVWVLKQAQQMVQPVYYITSGDYDKARQHLAPTTAAVLSDEKLKEFTEAVGAEVGKVDHMPKGLMGFLNGWGELGDVIQKAQQSGGRDGIPIPVHFEKDTALVMIYLQQGPSKGFPPIKNVSVHTKSGKVYWLIPPDSGP